LAVTVTGGNRHDVTPLLPLVDAVPAIRGRRGRPRRRFPVLVADRGYDHDTYRDQLRQRGITPLISRRRTRDDNTPARWVVEQTIALLHQYRRLDTRWERCPDIHEGFVSLACALICWHRRNHHTTPIC
jgi:transposase